jgi:hypothetical protein
MFLAALAFASPVRAQSLNAMGLNGASGLFTIPTGRIAWGKTADLGIDLGGSYNFVQKNPIVKAAFSLFKWVEVSTAFDFQPRSQSDKALSNTNALFGLKVQLPTGNTAVAVGGNMQIINHAPSNTNIRGQIYASATYSGTFFSMPAETTVVLGYTFRENMVSDIDYGMGFDMILLPNVFKRYLHWIVDFSNFSYSVDPLGADAYYRGCLNTGLRVDIGALPALKKFKFVVDIMMTDAFDEDRSFMIGAMFGMSIL